MFTFYFSSSSSEVSSVSTRDAEEPGVSTSRDRIAENVDGVGDKRVRGYHNILCRYIF
jgi:hypothetical protein